MKNKRIQFIPGLGEKPKEYKRLSKYLETLDVNWNTGKITPPIIQSDTLVGFSMGAILACEYALKHKVGTLILCSLTPMVESLKRVKTDNIIFLAGEKEKWIIKNIERVCQTLTCNKSIVIIPKADHKITSTYQKKLLEITDALRMS